MDHLSAVLCLCDVLCSDENETHFKEFSQIILILSSITLNASPYQVRITGIIFITLRRYLNRFLNHWIKFAY